ncbi:MAG: hypothetical protein NC543_09715 [bacterium]|nr:hypothetical protein [bacterium]MCM1376146.1 hypothetical protein [Muribaculum sp.]
MKDKKYRQFYLNSLATVLAASFYPIYMGIKVAIEVSRHGIVPMENYPKYIIPYTPISIAVILGVLLIPALQRLSERLSFLWGAVLSTAVFFVAERLMETNILIQSDRPVPLESWQMSLCIGPPLQYRTRVWEAVDVLLGGYDPAFKLHFYMISVIMIITLLNFFYGYARMIRSKDETRKKALIIQAVTSVSFIGMCIWACFTSFYRTGELTVSVLSAILMAVFFALMGITAGVFVSSFTLGKNAMLSVLLPAIVSAAVTLAMYIGEMILLNDNLYRFGTGILFEGMGKLILAPVDVLIILLSGSITALICRLITPSAAP